MSTIFLKLKKEIDTSYDIIIESGIFKNIPKILSQKNIGKKYLIITDSNVKNLYGYKLNEEMMEYSLPCEIYSFEAGEENKTRRTKEKIEDFMFEIKFGRDCVVLALGGGVVGDIAGFVAATFNRGIKFIQIPTTLLAISDSSIGGKTGVDTPWGKNLIGSFHQPSLVIIDPELLETLPQKEFISGMAEVIKHAIVGDRSLFDILLKNSGDILSRNSNLLEEIIPKNCSIKKDVVEKDEKESNLRKILNFGHTYGHAIETLMDYQLLHGECIAIGLIFESMLANELGILALEETELIREILKLYSLNKKINKKFSFDEVFKVMKLDKKVRSGNVEFVFPKKIGEMYSVNGDYGITIPEQEIKKVYEEFISMG